MLPAASRWADISHSVWLDNAFSTDQSRLSVLLSAHRHEEPQNYMEEAELHHLLLLLPARCSSTLIGSTCQV